MPTPADIQILRNLASRVAEIAALPIQEEKRKLWRNLNALKPTRPMVCIDQVCWHELNDTGQLTLHCSDEDCRQYEQHLRRTLYQWEHFPVDMSVEPFIRVTKAIDNTHFGLDITDETLANDPTNNVVSHKYINQLQTDADLDKIKTPVITPDQAETDRRLNLAHEIFDGYIDIELRGATPYLSLWDIIAMWMGVENALYAIVDKPDYVHEILRRMTEGYLAMLDQFEEQGLLDFPQTLIHCTGAHTDELPRPDFNPDKPRCKDVWMFGLAQMLATVSPAMFKEFEVDYTARIAERFGLVYYGCCDPLDGKMNEVRQIPNVRKVSMSPWTNQKRGVKEIGNQYVFSRKPNPAFLATDDFNPDQVRKDLAATRDLCKEYNCPLEFILKDISTIRYQPERLTQWADIAMQIACE